MPQIHGREAQLLPTVRPSIPIIMPCLKSRAFTLIELLVVITIIAVLAAVALPVFGSVQLSARKTQSLSNMRQLGALTLSYSNDHNELLPTQSDTQPTWSGSAQPTTSETTAWYNAVPREAGGRGLADYQNIPAAFYTDKSLFFVPAAKYPSNKLTAPLFAVAFNSKLYGSIGSETINTIRIPNLQLPARTCLFQESGLPGETNINSSQSSYNGQASSFASRSIARYNGRTIIVFADGHSEELLGNQVVAPSGKAYYPQLTPPGEVIWTIDPTASPN
jgi:prepilin-type N-terminal cleavage/methylation domain-containing protein/prepilin-type processing-associated H-X9-DG protein